MKKISFFLILFLAFALSSFADGVEFSGDIDTALGVAAPWTDKDSAAGHFTLGESSLTGKLNAYYANSSAYAEGTFSYKKNEDGNLGKGFNLSLNELFADYSSSFWAIRVGRQKASWGKSDGIDITNVLCPSDLSSVAAMVSENSKQAVDAIRFSASISTFTADVWWIPFFTPAELPKSLAARTIIEKPELAIWNGEYGLKLSGYFSSFDISLYGFYGWDDIPLFDYSVSSKGDVLINGRYKSMMMFGADAAIPIGETVIRLESAFFPQRYLQKKAQTIIEEKTKNAMIASMTGTTPLPVENALQKNQLSALAGIDWMPSGWAITAQYYCDYIPGNIDGLDRINAYTHGVTISVSRTLLSDTLELCVNGLLGLNDFDSMINPYAKYSVSDQFSVTCGAYILSPGPKNDGKFGSYKNSSSFYVNGKFSF